MCCVSNFLVGVVAHKGACCNGSSIIPPFSRLEIHVMEGMLEPGSEGYGSITRLSNRTYF